MFKKQLFLFFILFFSVINAQNNNFVSTWNIPSGTFELPIKDYTNITVDWGDGISTNHINSTFPIHTYGSSDIFKITVSVNDIKKDIGSVFMNDNHASRCMILDISNWGEGIWKSFSSAFEGSSNLTVSATDEPNLSATTSMLKAFKNCSSLVGATFNDWDVSTITNMKFMFSGNGGAVNEHVFMIFNGDISGWNTAAVTNMRGMFHQCIAFNVGGTQDLNNWNTAAVTNTRGMFNVLGYKDTIFNANISNWNTANVINMYGMFQLRTIFNSDISSWNTSKATNMGYMFNKASTFNRNISKNGDIWNTANVTDMRSMFSDAIAFDGDITSWDTSKVTNMQYMFNSAFSFNKNISTKGAIWNTAQVTDMKSMFSNAEVFDGDISSWNTTSVKNMESLFENAFMFNQNIKTNGDCWNTTNVTNMKWMFYYASNFAGDIQNWNTKNVTDMELMFYGADAFKDKVTIVFDLWNTNEAEKTAKKKTDPSFFPFKNKIAFKKYFNYLFGLIVLSLITIAYLLRKKFIYKNIERTSDTLIMKNIWSIKPLRIDFSENETKISKYYNKNELIKVFCLFEQNIFKDNIFEKQGVNIKEFSRASRVPLTHCFYLFKFHVNIESYTKFRNQSRIAVSLKLIDTNYLVKGTFESLSLKVGFESYSSFYNSFKTSTSFTPHEYLHSRKM